MKTYLKKVPIRNGEVDFIKKTRFGEIRSGLKQGGSYAFDEGAYKRFFDLTDFNGMKFLSIEDLSSENSEIGINYRYCLLALY